MQQSNLQRILADLGITPVYEYNGRTFYDTKDVFDRHNFARDVKRNVEEDEWVLEKTKYYLSERGVVMFAFKKGVSKGTDLAAAWARAEAVMERFLRVLEMPAFPETANPTRDPAAMVVGMAVADPMIDAKLSGMYDPAYLAATGYQYPNQNPYVMGMVGAGMAYPTATPQGNFPQQQQQPIMSKEQQDAYAAQYEAYQQQMQQQQQHYAQQAQQQQQQPQPPQPQTAGHPSQQQPQQQLDAHHPHQHAQQLYAQQQQYAMQHHQQQQMMQQQQQQQPPQHHGHPGDYGVPSADNLKAAGVSGVRDASGRWTSWGQSRDPKTSPESSVDEARRAAAALLGHAY